MGIGWVIQVNVGFIYLNCLGSVLFDSDEGLIELLGDIAFDHFEFDLGFVWGFGTITVIDCVNCNVEN